MFDEKYTLKSLENQIPSAYLCRPLKTGGIALVKLKQKYHE